VGFIARAPLLAAAIVAIAAAIAGGGCGAAEEPPRAAGPAVGGMATRSGGQGRPPIAVVAREGDARGAVAVAVTTEGVAPDRGALAATSLGALVEARLGARGVADASAVGGWDGWRLRALVGSPAEAASLVEAVRVALLTPVSPDEPALAAVARKAAALARRPLADRALADVARCTGEAFGSGQDAAPTAAELESWRRSAHGLGRVALATAGSGALADAVAGALARAPVWPQAAAPAPPDWPAADARPQVYDASGEIDPGGARVVVTARTAAAERAVAAAPTLGDPRGPLASRLAALDPPSRVRSVVATAHGDGGCVAVTIDLAAADLGPDAPARVATAAALARQELAVEIADTPAPPDLGRAMATRSADPRGAAERAAWWTLAGRRAGVAADDIRTTLTVGVAAPRDGGAAPPAPDAILAELDRATVAWHARVIEARTRVERGQGEVWLLLASPCGTLPEGNGDAGAGAAVAAAAAAQAAARAPDAFAEPFVSLDGVGLLVHGPPRAGESPQAHARRLADVAARALAADALEPAYVAQARTALLAHAAETDPRALGVLGGVVAPGHPSWLAPAGTSFGLASASESGVALRAAGMRAGPLRVAVVANADGAQADAAVRAADRWIVRRPGEARACPPLPALPPLRIGTYAVPIPAGTGSEALLAVPLVPGDDAARSAATWIASALDGPEGLLARALGPTRPDAPETALARGWSAVVLGAPHAPALVVRVLAGDASLDAAVAQVRSLLDRLRQGALREEDRARAAASLANAGLAASLSPRARTIDLWRSEGAPPAPSLDALRAFAASSLRDDTLVIVAARPPFTGREPKAKSRD
jgi:hypothetical protein